MLDGRHDPQLYQQIAGGRTAAGLAARPPRDGGDLPVAPRVLVAALAALLAVCIALLT